MYTMPLRTADGSIETPISICRNCGLHFRDVDYASTSVKTHFNVVDYVLDKGEEHYRSSREPFFFALMRIVESFRQATSGDVLLDIGCAYGHMMDVFHDTGHYDVYGVEINSGLRDRLTNRGLKVFETVGDIRETRFDVITMIDSLYYFESPIRIMSDVRERLGDDGLLLLRVTNRAWLADICRRLHLRVPYVFMGDAKYSFTHRAMRELLSRTGFVIERVIASETGKVHSTLKKRIFYGVTALLGKIGILISPGLIYIIRKKNKHDHGMAPHMSPSAIGSN